MQKGILPQKMKPAPFDNFSRQNISAVSDELLWQQYKNSLNKELFAEVVRRQQRFVFRVAFSVCSNSSMAEEAVQETFAWIANHPHRFAEQGDRSFRRWLFGVSQNRTRNIFRKEKRAQRRTQDQRFQFSEQRKLNLRDEKSTNLEARENLKVVEETLGSLDDDLRMPIVLHYLDGISQAEISRMMGVSQPRIRQRIVKGLGVLKTRLVQSGVVLSGVSLEKFLHQSTLLEPPSGLLERIVENHDVSLEMEPSSRGSSQGLVYVGTAAVVASLVAVIVYAQIKKAGNNESRAPVLVEETESSAPKKATIENQIEESVQTLFEDDFSEQTLDKEFWEEVFPSEWGFFTTLEKQSYPKSNLIFVMTLQLGRKGENQEKIQQTKVKLKSRSIPLEGRYLEFQIRTHLPRKIESSKTLSSQEVKNCSFEVGLENSDGMDLNGNLIKEGVVDKLSFLKDIPKKQSWEIRGKKVPGASLEDLTFRGNFSESQYGFYVFPTGELLMIRDYNFVFLRGKSSVDAARLVLYAYNNGTGKPAGWPISRISVRRLRELPLEIRNILNQN